jgi:HAMP domain-containing protein
MIETWDWILIYSILFLVGGVLARAENNPARIRRIGRLVRADRHGDAHRPPSMPG